jgi:hypothetical protein
MDVRVRVWIYIWKADTNGNGRPDPDEMMLVNYGYNWANWNLATMATPTFKLDNYKGIVVAVDLVRGPDASSYVLPVLVTVTVTYVDTAGDPWVSVSPSSATIPPGGNATFTLTVKPPANAVPTPYIGEAVVTNNVTGSVNRRESHHPSRVIYGASAAVDPHKHATSQAPKLRSAQAEARAGKLPIGPDGEPDHRRVGKSPTGLYLKCKAVGSTRRNVE